MAINWLPIIMLSPDRIKKLPDLTMHLIANIWHVLPVRQEDGQKQVYKNRELTCHLLIVGLFMTGAVAVTVSVMTGPRFLTSLDWYW